MKHAALVHEREDDVAVVIRDVSPGTKILAVDMEGREVVTVNAAEEIPLGHKIALRALKKGEKIKKYGRSIGKATRDIKQGAHVHVQNIKSERWG
jgi:(2R)-sulfolactate sulfo-lyase subunit alpha